MKGINLLRKLRTLLPRQSLFTSYKFFVRLHLDNGHVIYDQPLNGSLSNRIQPIQCKAVLAITEAMQDSSREKLYQKLVLEHSHQRR